MLLDGWELDYSEGTGLSGLRTVLARDGREIAVGNAEDVRAAMEDISQAKRAGSVSGGGWLYFLGFGYGSTHSDPFDGCPPGRLANDAADVRMQLDEWLSDATKSYLDRLVRVLRAAELSEA